jgi:hypothetical protein
VSLVVRRHQSDGRESEAVYSPCDRYRYALKRVWERDAPRLLYVMLNPSKATEEVNDPTIERCERRARQLGYGGFGVANLFAYRETHPALLKQAADPVGLENDAQIAGAFRWADDVLCAWGVHGDHLNRADRVRQLLRATAKPVLVLGLTKAGHPRHPLYLPYATKPCLWR